MILDSIVCYSYKQGGKKKTKKQNKTKKIKNKKQKKKNETKNQCMHMLDLFQVILFSWCIVGW